ncbi:MAG: hypothetical protein LBK44_02905 [Spirochaetales bacterium]|jgi:TolB-like protein|nr:hypothetical protein [Spirochaetales bacterium]
MKKLKILVVFYIILITVWYATEPAKPRQELSQKITRRKFPEKTDYAFPKEYAEVHKEFSGIFAEIPAAFPQGTPVLVLPAFTMTGGNNSSALPEYVTESAYSYLSKNRNVRIVRRDYNSKTGSRIKAKYILIGRVNPIENQIRVSVRIENIASGEILDYFEKYIDKNKVAGYLTN